MNIPLRSKSLPYRSQPFLRSSMETQTEEQQNTPFKTLFQEFLENKLMEQRSISKCAKSISKNNSQDSLITYKVKTESSLFLNRFRTRTQLTQSFLPPPDSNTDREKKIIKKQPILLSQMNRTIIKLPPSGTSLRQLITLPKVQINKNVIAGVDLSKINARAFLQYRRQARV